jgi:hypothetical protein
MHLSRSPYFNERDIKGGEIMIFTILAFFKKGIMAKLVPFFYRWKQSII